MSSENWAQNIFMPKKEQSITIVIISDGIKKIKTEKKNYKKNSLKNTSFTIEHCKKT